MLGESIRSDVLGPVVLLLVMPATLTGKASAMGSLVPMAQVGIRTIVVIKQP